MLKEQNFTTHCIVYFVRDASSATKITITGLPTVLGLSRPGTRLHWGRNYSYSHPRACRNVPTLLPNALCGVYANNNYLYRFIANITVRDISMRDLHLFSFRLHCIFQESKCFQYTYMLNAHSVEKTLDHTNYEH